MKICVVGAGYVGLVTSACFAELGHDVVCADIDKRKIASLKQRHSPIFEPGLDELIGRNVRQGRLSFTSNSGKAIRACQVIFIAVGTPPLEDGQPDTSQVMTVAREIGKNLNGEKIIVDKSTVPVGMGDLVASIIKEHPGSKHLFSVVSNPEFLREGNAVQDFMNPDRIVIGANDRKAADKIRQLFRPLNAPIMETDVRSAEMIKYASNAFLACKISFINEIAALCEKVGADISEVARGMGLDKRIGSAFLQAGAGFGGSCFPKDTKALAHLGRREGAELKLIDTTILVNTLQKRRMVDKLKTSIGPLEGKTIAIWGLAFKANTDDMREAVAVDVIQALLASGARVRAYDPAAMKNAKTILPRIGYSKDPYEAARDADALMILTEWNEFKQADLRRVKSLLRSPVIIDGRNLYDLGLMRKLGIQYQGVGRLS